MSLQDKRQIYLRGKTADCIQVHEGATTKACIEDNRRTKDEMAMFEKMWPGWLVKILMHFYVKAYDEYGNS